MESLNISRHIGHWPFCGSKTGEFGLGSVAAFIDWTKMTDWLPSEEVALCCEVEAVGLGDVGE